MTVSTKGRYALRVMTDLAQHADEGFISLREVAERQNLSLKYIEILITIMCKHQLAESCRGKTGGYRLAVSPESITVAQIVGAAEGTLVPVSCLKDEKGCERADTCLVLPVWRKLDSCITDCLSGITLRDIIDREV